MSNESYILVKKDNTLEYAQVPDNSLVTSDLTPINLPKDNGNYCLNVSKGSKSFVKMCSDADPIILQQSFSNDSSSLPSNVVTKTSGFKYSMPNGRYLMLMDVQVLNWARRAYGIPTLGFAVDGEYYNVTYLNDFSTTFTGNTIVNITDNTLKINVKAVDCDNYIYDNFKITLIPI